jgi:beta-lactamase regulating signal transducer with metallopeptidase domain
MSPLLLSLAHSLWVGLVLWLAVLSAFYLLPAKAASWRHLIAVMASVLLVMGWVVMWMLLSARVERASVSHTMSGDVGAIKLDKVLDTESKEARIIPEGVRYGGAESVEQFVDDMNRRARGWAVLEWVWCVGVALGFMRLIIGFRWRLQRHLGAQLSDDVPDEWRLIWELHFKEMASSFRVKLKGIQGRGAPFVIGIIYPVIVVPFASCSGVSPELIRVAMAHEFAHVVRRDWLVEIWLRVAEAVLFFNPFVWLIAARVRDEREACCDDWGCRVLGESEANYAMALVEWGHRLVGIRGRVTSAMALSGSRGNLKQRVERLLGLGRDLPTRLETWGALVGVMSAILIAMAGATGVAVWGARALRAEERVMWMAAVVAPYQGGDPWTEPAKDRPDERMVEGIVCDELNNPIRGARVAFSTNKRNLLTATNTLKDGVFQSESALVGVVKLTVSAKGYATKRISLGPKRAPEPLRIVMDQGFTCKVLITDEADVPIKNARIERTSMFAAREKKAAAITDDRGYAEVTNLSEEMDYYLTVEADGYAINISRQLRAIDQIGEPIVLRLKAVKPSRLTIISEATGAPLRGYKVSVDAEGPSGHLANPLWSYLRRQSNEEGVVQLDHLNSELAYKVEVTAPTGARFTILHPQGGGQELVARIPQAFVVDIVLLNFPKEWDSQFFRLDIEQTEVSALSPVNSVDVALRKGSGQVLLGGLNGGPLRLEFSNREYGVEIPSVAQCGGRIEIDFLKLDSVINAQPIRKVIIRFQDGNERIYPSGYFYLDRFKERGAHRKGSWVSDGFSPVPDVPLIGEWPDGTRLQLSENSRLLGVRLDISDKAKNRLEWTVSESLREIIVPVKPAGVIRAQVRSSEGDVRREASVYGFTLEPESKRRKTISFPNSMRDSGEWQISETLAFTFREVPIWGVEGLVFARGPSVNITERKPIEDVVITLPPKKDYILKLLDEEGGVIVGASCELSIRVVDANSGFGYARVTSDKLGMLRFEAGVDLTRWKNKIEVKVQPEGPGFVPISVAVAAGNFRGIPEVGLMRAARFRGRVLNQKTGKGVPDIRVNWSANILKDSIHHFLRLTTDAEGWFELQNIPRTTSFRLNLDIPRGFVLESKQGSIDLNKLTSRETGVTIFVNETTKGKL